NTATSRSAPPRQAAWATQHRNSHLQTALSRVGLSLPPPHPIHSRSHDAPVYHIDRPLQVTTSRFVRLTRISLPQLVELIRGQTAIDYRPNKHIHPYILSRMCSTYEHLPPLLDIAYVPHATFSIHSPHQPHVSHPTSQCSTQRHTS
ncbi:TPA: hypothetical protein N0F65_010202, partial [Lagenidium giganteum]